MSVSYQLPDGATMEFDQPASALDIAGRISKKLAKQALAAKVNGNLIDVYLPIDDGATVEIVTRDTESARAFERGVDAACVYVNASTRFTDGGEFGMGAEIGNSTQKLHARGPIGVRELCTFKYVVSGDGHIRS